MNPKSWRDIYKVHPAADLFPLLPDDELRKLGEDIKANGLKEHIFMYSAEKDGDGGYVVLDGRNRLDAMELVGMTVIEKGFRNLPNGKAGEWGFKSGMVHYVNRDFDTVDPYTYVISKNIRRRHLTKEQQADLIVKVMKAKNDFANVARSFSPEVGKRGGSTKDIIKQAAVDEGKKHGIGPRTVERAIAKDKGPKQKLRKKTGIAGYVNGVPVPYVDGIATLGASTCSTTGKTILTGTVDPKAPTDTQPKPDQRLSRAECIAMVESIRKPFTALIVELKRKLSEEPDSEDELMTTIACLQSAAVQLHFFNDASKKWW